MSRGTYHLQGKTGNSGWKITWFAPSRNESFRKWGLCFEVAKFSSFFSLFSWFGYTLQRVVRPSRPLFFVLCLCTRFPPGVCINGRGPHVHEVTDALTLFKGINALRVISIKYQCFVKQSGQENCGHDHTRWICLIFYQLLLTASVGNE